MAAANAEPVIEKNLDLEPGRFGAKLTTVEVAKHLKVHPSTIYRQLKRGRLPAFKVGSDWRFNIESIDRWRLEQDTFKPL